MSNILQHNRKIFDIKLDKSEYWDFHLCVDRVGSSVNSHNNECLSAEIDFNDSDCVWFDEVYSKPNIIWDESVSDDITLNSIGFTGIDNGLFTYEKDKITNKEFLDIFLNSQYVIDSSDKRLKLKKVAGNNQLYDYANDIVILDDENQQVAQLNGGFYQGFFKLEGFDYQVLPLSMGQHGWTFSFELKKEDFINDNLTLNDKYPENKGIFFFIGTRAENKWYKNYINNDENVIIKTDNRYNDDYSNDYIQTDNITEQINYQTKEETIDEGEYFSKDYVKKDDYFNSQSDCCNYYAENSYIEEDEKLPNEKNLKTEEGYDLYQPNIIEYKTDNKFITYNRTKEGFKANENVDDEIILYDIKVPNMENYFLLFDRTCDGYTTQNIDKLIEEKNKQYNILDDLYRNALAFQIKDNGSIGYKYFVKDCDKDNDDYKIESEFSNENIIKNDEWYNIKIVVESVKNKQNRCQNSSDGKMRFYFYVNNKLVLISKILPILKLRKLNDIYSKQEGVPYSISIGGGTQGLCDVVNLNYMEVPSDVLPIEKEFAGSFIGYVKSFKFYNCKYMF